MNFNLEVVSPEKRLFSGEVEKVIIPALTGQLTILAKHMPLICPLETGRVEIKTGKKVIEYSIGKGFFSVAANEATLLIEDVLAADEISEERALEAKRKAQEIIQKGPTGKEKKEAIYSLRKSLIDLRIVLKRKKRILPD